MAVISIHRKGNPPEAFEEVRISGKQLILLRLLMKGAGNMSVPALVSKSKGGVRPQSANSLLQRLKKSGLISSQMTRFDIGGSVVIRVLSSANIDA